MFERNGVTLTTPEITTYDYTAVGSRASIEMPNGTRTTYQYDNLNRLTKLSNLNSANAILSEYQYTLHATGRRTAVVEKRLEEDASLSTTTINWQYDSMYRLTQEARTEPTGTTFTDDYVYDLVGNRLQKSSAGGSPTSVSYQYNNNDQLLQETGSDYAITYQYDANGSQTLKQRTGTDPETYAFAYNLENRLASATISRTENGTSVLLSTAYLYNQHGIRVRTDATRTIGGVTSYETKLFLNDPNNHTGYSQVLEELSDNGSTVSVARSYTIGDDVLAQATGPTTQYLAYDGHGSTRLLTGSGGAIVSRFSYDAYGLMLGGQPSTLNAQPSTLLYAGEQFDSDLAHYYLRARYYDPSNGRFTRLDPFAGNNFDWQSLHKYAYAHQDPVNGIDASGMIVSVIEFGLVSSFTIGVRAQWEWVRLPIYVEALRRAAILASLIGAGILAGWLADVWERVKRDREIREVYYRYDALPGLLYFGPGTDVTTRGDLTWSQALSITFYTDIDTLYMYTILARRGEVGPHPDGPIVMGIPQFQLVKTISAPNVIQTRVLRRGEG